MIVYTITTLDFDGYKIIFIFSTESLAIEHFELLKVGKMTSYDSIEVCSYELDTHIESRICKYN